MTINGSDVDTDSDCSETATIHTERLTRGRHTTPRRKSNLISGFHSMAIEDNSPTARSSVSDRGEYECVSETEQAPEYTQKSCITDATSWVRSRENSIRYASTDSAHHSERSEDIPQENISVVSVDEGYSSRSLYMEDIEDHSPKCARLFHTGIGQTEFQNCILSSEVESSFSQDKDGDTPLHLAIILQDIPQSERYISIAPNYQCLNIVNNQRQTLLHLAIILKLESVARRLMTSGASVDVRDSNGNTPLHIACREGDMNLVQCLLKPVSYQETLVNKYEIPFQRIPQNLETRNYDGYTCLHVASLNKHIGIVQLLLKKGAKINSGDGKSGRTILHHAAETGDEELIEFLLTQRKVKINCLTYGRRTPVYLAAGRGYSRIVEYLIAHGADCSFLRMRDDASDDESMDDDFHINGKPISRQLC